MASAGRAARKARMAFVAWAVLGSGALVLGEPEPEEASAAGPVISAVSIGPVAAGAPVAVTASVVGAEGSVVVDHVADFGAEQAIELHDDGASGDGPAGDGTYGGLLPARPAGTLVRYRVRTGAATSPVEDDGRRYAGYLVDRPAVATQAPVLEWYLDPADAAWLAEHRTSKTYVPAVLVVAGRVIDGVRVRNQGGTTSQLSPKPNYKFKLPDGEAIGPPLFPTPIDEFVADADHEDPTYGLDRAASLIYARHGVPERYATTARVERNGTFYGVYQLLEELEKPWRRRVPYDVGAVYEMVSGKGYLIDEGTDAALRERWEKQYDDDDPSLEDLRELVQGVDGRPADSVATGIFDRFDVPRLVDFLAVSVLIQSWDIGASNLDLVSDEDTGRWQLVPTDLDLVLGLRDRTRFDLVVPAALPGVIGLASAFDPRLPEMVFRRIRSLLDVELDEVLVQEVRDHIDPLRPDIALDRAKGWLGVPDPDQGLADLADFVQHQRQVILGAVGPGLVPEPQAPTSGVEVSEVRAGGDDGDFVELANSSPRDAVDLSGWRLTGSVDAALPGGTVVPSGGRVVVPVSARAVGERREGVLVAGALDGPLPTVGGSVVVRDPGGTARDAVTWGVGGDWPDPAGSGRSIEATALGADRGSGAGWQLSREPGGTPGAVGAARRGLSVAVWTGRATVEDDVPFAVRVTVEQAGPGPSGPVTVDSTVDECDRVLPSILAGGRAVFTCTAVRRWDGTGLGYSLVPVHVRATSGAQPEGVDGTAQLAVSPVVALERPLVRSVTLAGSAGLRVRFTAPGAPFAAGPDERFRRWRTDAQLIPEGPAAPAGHVIEDDGDALVPAASGTRVGLRLVSRTVLALGQPSVPAPPITPQSSTSFPEASTATLVDRFFAELAGRAPTTGERSSWAAQIDGGRPAAELAVELLGRSRWTDQADPVIRLYLATFGRSPDGSGLTYWVDRRRRGTSLAAVAAAFTSSAEFRARYAGLDAAGFVDRVYRNVFDRAPDPSGLAYWTGRVEAGLARGTVVLQFSESAEGRRRFASRVQALGTWFALAGGVPTAGWQADAVAWLDAGGDRATLVDSIRSTDGYAAR